MMSVSYIKIMYVIYIKIMYDSYIGIYRGGVDFVENDCVSVCLYRTPWLSATP